MSTPHIFTAVVRNHRETMWIGDPPEYGKEVRLVSAEDFKIVFDAAIVLAQKVIDDAKYILEGSVASEGQTDADLEAREEAFKRVFDAEERLAKVKEYAI